MNNLVLLDGIERAQQRLSLQPHIFTSVPLPTSAFTKVVDITGAGVIETINISISSLSLPPTPVAMKFVVDGVSLDVNVQTNATTNKPGFFLERSPENAIGVTIRFTPFEALSTRIANLLNINFAKSFQLVVLPLSGTPTTGVWFTTTYSLYK